VTDSTGRVAIVFDLDGTIADGDTYLAYLLGFARRHPRRWLRMLELPFDVLRFKLGLRDNTWLKERFLKAVFGGMHREAIEAWTKEFNTRLMLKGLRPKALEQIRRYRQQGLRLLLVTASPNLYVLDLSRRLGFSDCVCTCVQWDKNGRLSGRLQGGNCYGSEKRRRLQRLFGAERQRWWIVAYCDHHSDLSLLTWADEGVAVTPTRTLAREAARRGLRVLDWSSGS